MANRASVPKFGTWDSDNVGYTVYFEKVRENKGATAPPLQRPFNPNDPEEEDAPPRLIIPSAFARPASSSSGHRAASQQQQNNGQQHRQTGSNISVASDPGGHRGGHQSKFAPPPQYQPRPHASPHHQVPPTGKHGGDHGHHPRPAGHQKPHDARHQHQQKAAPRARSASPHNGAPGARQRPVAVPKFGVWEWEEQNAAAQGFTVQFGRVKRDREVARAALPGVPRRRMPSPESYAAARRPRSIMFYSNMFGCFMSHPRD